MNPIYLSGADHPECATKADVYLDGYCIPMIYVVAAHEGEGWVERRWMDERGNPITTYPPQRKTGRVEIRPKPGVTREELERLARPSELVQVRYVGSDGETHLAYAAIPRQDANALIALIHRALPVIRIWAEASPCCQRCGQLLNNVSPGYSAVSGGYLVCAHCLRPGEEILRARGM